MDVVLIAGIGGTLLGALLLGRVLAMRFEHLLDEERSEFDARLIEDPQHHQRYFPIQREYHLLGLSQSKRSFTLGYLFGAFGAAVLLAGAVKIIFFTDGASRSTIATYTAVAGAITEAIAGLLFVLANRAGSRMMKNFDRGREDRDLAIAREIATQLEDKTLGDRLHTIVALSMCRVDVDADALEWIYRHESEARTPAAEGNGAGGASEQSLD